MTEPWQGTLCPHDRNPSNRPRRTAFGVDRDQRAAPRL